jgi:hypothetical protein
MNIFDQTTQSVLTFDVKETFILHRLYFKLSVITLTILYKSEPMLCQAFGLRHYMGKSPAMKCMVGPHIAMVSFLHYVGIGNKPLLQNAHL